MVPPYGQRFTGYSGDDFVESGKGLVSVLASTSGLTAGSNVLDIGSGIGRLAIPLTQLITSPGSYDGLEIVERGVHWCTRNITPMHPHFRFTHANIWLFALSRGRYAVCLPCVIEFAAKRTVCGEPPVGGLW